MLAPLQEALPRVPGQPDQQPVPGPGHPVQSQRAAASLPPLQGGRQPQGGGGKLRLPQPTAGGAGDPEPYFVKCSSALYNDRKAH